MHNRAYAFRFPIHTASEIRVQSSEGEYIQQFVDTQLSERLRFISRFFIPGVRVNGSSVDFHDESFVHEITLHDLPVHGAFTLSLRAQDLSSITITTGSDTLLMMRPEWHHESLLHENGHEVAGEPSGSDVRSVIIKLLQNVLLILTPFVCVYAVINVLSVMGSRWHVRQETLRRGGTRLDSDHGGNVLQRYAQPALFLTLCGLLVFLYLLTLLYTVDSVLAAFPHTQDELTYIFQSKLIGNGLRLYIPSLPPVVRSFFDHEFIVNNGKWYGMYTIGTPVLLALGQALHVMRLANPVVSVVSTMFLLWILRKIQYPRLLSLLIGVVFVISPMRILLSSSYLSHPLAELCTLVVFAGALLRIPLLGGVGGGLLFITRPYNALIMGLWYVCWNVGMAVIQRHNNRGERLSIRIAQISRHLWKACAGAAPFVVFQLFHNLSATGSPFEMPMTAYSAHNTIGFGMRGTEWGSLFTPVRAVELLIQNTQSLADMFLPLPFVIALVPCMLGLLSQRRKLALAACTICMFQVVAYVPFHGNGIYYGPRYWSEVLFALAVLFGLGIEYVGNKLPGFMRMCVHPALVILVLVLSSTIFLNPVLNQFQGNNGMLPPDAVMKELEGKRAIVFVASADVWQQYGKYFVYQDPFMQGNLIFARMNGLHNVATRRGEPIANEVLITRYPGRELYSITATGTLQRYSRYEK